MADVQLISELRRFEIATPDNAAVAEISVKIVSDRDGRIVNGRIFRAAVPASAVDAPNAARALDEALSVVMLDIVRWVSGATCRGGRIPAPQRRAKIGRRLRGPFK